MAPTATKVFPTERAFDTAINSARKPRRRSIDPQTGRVLVILGHAIEYLTDEFIYAGGSFTANRGQVEAIQLLMKLNWEIYMACPEAPSIRQWLSSLLHGDFKGSSALERALQR